MSHKIHPYAFRLGVTKNHRNKWFALSKSDYSKFVQDGIAIEELIRNTIGNAGIAELNIVRSDKRLDVHIHVLRPGIAIGPKGATVQALRKKLKKLVGLENVDIKVTAVKNPNMTSAIIAQNIARAIEKRRPVKGLVKKSIEQIRRSGAQGAKIVVSGRITGGEQSMKYKRQFGRVPLHTLRADIDYAYERAQTATAGIISVKVWIYKGEIYD